LAVIERFGGCCHGAAVSGSCTECRTGVKGFRNPGFTETTGVRRQREKKKRNQHRNRGSLNTEKTTDNTAADVAERENRTVCV